MISYEKKPSKQIQNMVLYISPLQRTILMKISQERVMKDPPSPAEDTQTLSEEWYSYMENQFTVFFLHHSLTLMYSISCATVTAPVLRDDQS